MAALLLVLRTRARRFIGVLVGLVLGALVIKVLDMGFRSVFRRSFDPVTDWTYVGSARDLLSDSIGPLAAVVVPGVRRCRHGGCAGRHAAVRASPVGTRGPAPGYLCPSSQGSRWPGSGARQRGQSWSRARGSRPPAQPPSASDHWHSPSRAARPPGLRPRSGGRPVPRRGGPRPVDRPARQGRDHRLRRELRRGRGPIPVSDRVAARLDAGTARLGPPDTPPERAADVADLWRHQLAGPLDAAVRSVGRQPGPHDALLERDRLTLSGAFKRAGWRTVCHVPANRRDWPEVPPSTAATSSTTLETSGMPVRGSGTPRCLDQYTLKAFYDRELARSDRAPVMAEIDLVSSHPPWAPLPRLIGWDEVGDGSVYAAMR